MACNRMLLGSALVIAYLIRLPELGTLFLSGSTAWFPPFRTVLSGRSDYPLRFAVSWLEPLSGETRSAVLVGLYCLLLFAAASFALGVRTRLSGTVALLLHLFFVTINPIAYWGWSALIFPFFLYTLLSPSGRVLSWDARRCATEPEDWQTSAWPIRLVQIHVCVMYFETGVARLDDERWLAGQMLYEALTNTLVTRLAIDWHPWREVLEVFCYGTFLLEPLAPLLLCIPRLRTPAAVALIALHIGLELLTRVGMWNFLMIGGLLTFLPANWLHRMVGRGPGERGRAPSLTAQGESP